MFGIEAMMASIAITQAQIQSGVDPKDLPKWPEKKQQLDSNTDFLTGVIIGEIISGNNR